MAVVGQAVGVFVVTNVDDVLILALLFGRAGSDRRAVTGVVAGQYAGFAVILAASVAGALGAGLLPDSAIPYLGLLPILLGLRAAWEWWRGRRDPDDDAPAAPALSALAVAGVTVANGGDNIGVYVPVLATAGPGGMTVYVLVFLVLVGVWVAAGRFVATRPMVAKALGRWGHVLLPVVLIALGLLILLTA